MDRLEKLVETIKQSQKNVKFSDLMKICDFYFGEPRQRGTSHIVDCKQSQAVDFSRERSDGRLTSNGPNEFKH